MGNHLISTPVQPGHCTRCRAKILYAIEFGIPAQVDARPVDAAGEVAAWQAGRWTYALLANGELAHRDMDRVRGRQVGLGVFAAHRCPPIANYSQHSFRA